MKQMLVYMNGYRKLFVIAILAIMIATAMELATPIIIKYAIDTVIGNEPAGYFSTIETQFGRHLWVVVVLIVIASIIRGLFLFIKGVFSNIAAEKIAERLKNQLYEHIQYMPFSFHSESETGDLVQRCTSDVEMIRKFLGVQIADLGRIVFMVALSVTIMLTLNAKLTVFAVALIPILFLFSWIFFKEVQKRFRLADEAEGELTTVLQENLSGVRVVRAFGREAHEMDKFDVYNTKYRTVTYKLIESLGVFWGSADFITYLQSGIVLIMGGQMVANDEITLGTLVAFITFESMLLFPVKQSGRLLSELGKTTVSIQRIEEILNTPIEAVNPSDLKPAIKGKIDFEKVSFEYEPGKKVLDDISFEVEAGQTVGILGATGSGKSTLVQLLQRLYPYEGNIKIDGISLERINHHWIRENVGLVLQEPYLYAKNIKENIGIINPDYSFSAIQTAAETAAIHQSIEHFKEGYETLIGEKGVSLSGGQKQRIAIARTIIDAKKPILVFDDSLSAVDTETDISIRKALDACNPKPTTFMISHRITTLAKSDIIIVLNAGKIVQKGTHESLLAEKGPYQKIWQIQQAI